MAILTLTTDWGNRDSYVAAFKGELLGICPEVQLVDISHEVERFNVLEASFIMRSAYHRFPKGTVHYIGMSGNGSPSQSEYFKDFLVVKTADYFFLGIDSGIFSLMLGDRFESVYRLPIEANQGQKTITTAVIHALGSLLNDKKIQDIGKPHDSLIQRILPHPTVDPESLRGTVLYIDSFGNAIVNISKELFEEQLKGRRFNILFRKSNYVVHRISRSYEDVEVGEIVALFNRENLLEIALNRESAKGLLGIKIMDPIRIDFHNQ